VIALVLACSTPGPVADDTGAASDRDLQSTEPTWTVDEAAAALRELASYGLPYPGEVRTWFENILLDLRDNGGDECPAIDGLAWDSEGNINSNYDGECEGAAYAVNGGWLYTVTVSPVEDAVDIRSAGLFSFVGISPTAGDLEAGGELTEVLSVRADGTCTFNLALGGWYYEEGNVGPLGVGLGAGIEWEGSRGADGHLAATLNGSVGVGEDLAAHLEDLTFDTASCGASVAGSVRVRDPSSGWWTLAFGDTCATCAEASFGGVTLGEACVAEELMAAAQAPWQDATGE
jgi:hypothetical protein